MLAGLKILDIGLNRIVRLDDNVMQWMGSITELFVGSNQISVWPRSLKHLHNLQSLDMSKNPLAGKIPNDAFNGFESTLKTLFIYSIGLQQLPLALKQLTNLTILDMGRNPLEDGVFLDDSLDSQSHTLEHLASRAF